jgi:hypothetical protein
MAIRRALSSSARTGFVFDASMNVAAATLTAIEVRAVHLFRTLHLRKYFDRP